MLPSLRVTLFSGTRRVAWLAVVLFFLPTDLFADTNTGSVVCRSELALERREELASKLRKITGWHNLNFDTSGALRLGTNPVGGSGTARELLSQVVAGNAAVVIEDASQQADVAFCQVLPARWKSNVQDPRPAFVVQIDFADFENVIGERRVLQAFNVGWGLLHELDHVVNNSRDPACLGDPGECEAHINRMRLECGLPIRAEYFHTNSPLAMNSSFISRLVQLSFEEQQGPGKKKKRYLVVWDAELIGGITQDKKIAALQ